MKHNSGILAAIIFAFVLQSLWIEFLPVFGYGPDIILITIIYLSLRYGSLYGETYGFFSGILVDVFDISIFGSRALVFTVIGYLCGMLSKQLDESKIKTQVLLTFVASYVVIIFLYLVSSIFVIEPVKKISLIICPVASSILAPFVFILYNWWFNKVEKWSGKGKEI